MLKRYKFYMINRALLRIKVIQILYSYYKGDVKSLPLIEKELFFSLEKTYDLYFQLLQLSIEITRYAELRIEARRSKLRPTEEDLNPNTRFIDNRFINQLVNNETLVEYLSKKKLSWVNYPELIKSLYDKIVASDIYTEYMESAGNDYEADKDIWRKIYKRIVMPDPDFDESLEEQSIFWTDDLEIIISFVIKTIKKFDPANGSEQELLPMFRDEEDREFGRKLLEATILNEQEYRAIIDQYTKNWELDRIAFMDILIMQTAIAEICAFPTIPVNVTLNEYIEISKKFSTEKSGTFINGVLDKVVNQLKSENKFIKVMMFTDNKK